MKLNIVGSLAVPLTLSFSMLLASIVHWGYGKLAVTLIHKFAQVEDNGLESFVFIVMETGQVPIDVEKVSEEIKPEHSGTENTSKITNYRNIDERIRQKMPFIIPLLKLYHAWSGYLLVSLIGLGFFYISIIIKEESATEKRNMKRIMAELSLKNPNIELSESSADEDAE